MKVRTILYAVLALNAALIGCAIFLLIRGARAESQRIALLKQANSFSDALIQAAAFEARERGFSVALMSPAGSDAKILARVEDARKQGDAACAEAQKQSEEIAAALPAGSPLKPGFEKGLSQWQESLKRLTQDRERVDASRGPAADSIEAKEWIGSITGLIRDGRALRLAACAPVQPAESIVNSNARIKDFAWLASEYAGLERATVGGSVAGGKPISPEARLKLAGYRGIVDEAIGQLESADMSSGSATKAAVQAMRDEFLGSFETLRQQVYAASDAAVASSQPPVYPVDAQHWLAASTSAIDSILAVASSLSEEAAGSASAAMSASRRTLLWALLLAACAGLAMAAGLLLIHFRVVQPLGRTGRRVAEVTRQHDLRLRVPSRGSDEFSQLAVQLNGLLGEFQTILGQVSQLGLTLAASSEQLAAAADETGRGTEAVNRTADDLLQRSNEGSLAVRQVSERIQRNNEGIRQIRVDIDRVAAVASEAAQGGNEGRQRTAVAIEGIMHASEQVKATAQLVETLGQRTTQITGFIDTISGIADQTNLLALNAAIEAARAGESGRGFAVVAEEVRKLAVESNRASASIHELVKAIDSEMAAAISSMHESDEQVNQGVEKVQSAVGLLDGIVRKVEHLDEEVSDIRDVAGSIAAASEDISGAVHAMSEVAEGNSSAARDVSNVAQRQSASTEEVSASAQNLARLAQDLQEHLVLFKI